MVGNRLFLAPLMMLALLAVTVLPADATAARVKRIIREEPAEPAPSAEKTADSEDQDFPQGLFQDPFESFDAASRCRRHHTPECLNLLEPAAGGVARPQRQMIDASTEAAAIGETDAQPSDGTRSVRRWWVEE